MNKEETMELLRKPEYKFLTENEHLGDHIVLLTYGGSHSYGTNIATSDVDIRGVAIEDVKEILGSRTFEQVINEETDTTIYGLNKFVSLLYQCNPNIIEMLGCKDYIYVSHLGKILLDNKNLFLSKKAAYSFGGYATAQLRRIQNAMYRDRMPEEMLNKHIAQSMNNAMNNFHRLEQKIKVDFGITVREEKNDCGESELVVDFDMKGFPVGKLSELCSELTAINRDYKNSIGKRNKKDDEHMCKHMMHLIRLYHMGIEILKTGEINTYRESDHDLLMDIRNGKYMDENGLATEEFFKMVDQLEAELKEAAANSKLPDVPDVNKIDDFLIMCNKMNIVDNYRSRFIYELNQTKKGE